MVINNGREALTQENGYDLDYVEAAQKYMNKHTKGSWIRTGDWPLVLKNEKTGEYCDLHVYEDIEFERISNSPSWNTGYVGKFYSFCESINQFEYIAHNYLKPKYHLAISESCNRLAMLDMKQLSYCSDDGIIAVKVKRSDIIDL